MVTRQMAVFEVQEAVQAKLTGDSTLMGIITGVGEQIPEGQAFPYISYGSHVDGTWPTFGKWNSEAFFLLDIWSNASGGEECYRILAEVIRLLQTRPDNPPLTLAGNWGQVAMKYDWSTILPPDEFGVRHMPVRFISQAVET